MSSPHRPLDRRSGLVLDTHELGRRAGAMKVIQSSVDAPADLGIAVIGVPPGSPIELDVRLESVVEGVLVTGTATVAVSRRVRSVPDRRSPTSWRSTSRSCSSIPSSEASEDEASRLEGDLIDLEPLLRDDVVLDLPFQPLCREDCAGLCVECGANLNAIPTTLTTAPIDPRWEKLRRLEGEGQECLR